MNIDSLASLKRLRLLYVEDDADTREELATMLAYWVGELDVAPDGLAGLGLFELQHPHIVLTDLQMPVMNGLEMCAAIHKLVPDQLILALTAHNDLDYAAKAQELGVTRYITKPVNVEHLLSVLAELAVTVLPSPSLSPSQEAP